MDKLKPYRQHRPLRRKKSTQTLEPPTAATHCSFDAFRQEVQRRFVKSKLRGYVFPRQQSLSSDDSQTSSIREMQGIIRLNLKKPPRKITRGRSVIDSSLKLHLKTLQTLQESKRQISKRPPLRQSIIYKTIEAKSSTFRMSLSKGRNNAKDNRQSNTRAMGIQTSLDRPNLRRSQRIKTLANVQSISLNRANLQAMMHRLKMASARKKRYASLQDD